MEQTNERKKYLPEKRAEIMKQHLLEKKALSEVCDANGIHPTMYYRWLKELMTKAVYAFGKGKDRTESARNGRIRCWNWKRNLPAKTRYCQN